MIRLGLFLLAAIVLAPASLAQEVNIDLGAGQGLTEGIVQLLAVITVLSLAPSILIMTTSFVRIVVVMSLLRTAIGLQQSPPNTVIVSLALFLTAFIMAPTFQASYEAGIEPFMAEALPLEDALPRAAAPVKAFMGQHVNDEDLMLFADLAQIETLNSAEEAPFHVLAPAFMISELKRAFEIGFMIFLPFIIIDLVVASLLMSMGMMMLPPVTISLPFKLIFFVLVDGWRLLSGSLVESFVAGPPI
ncbi:MAG: flagellar type III secretion system pore protein FliP [Pseudomonadota bacterium]